MAVPNPYNAVGAVAGVAQAVKKPKVPAPASPSAASTAQVPKPSVPGPTAAQPKDAYAQWGGKDAYAAGQNKRWQAANQSNDTGLMSRLIADSQTHGYELAPYSVPKPTVPAPPAAPQPVVSPEYTQWRGKMDQLFADYERLAATPFTYDPNTDEGYQAMRTLSQQRAKGATQSALEEMNSRGILNSSVTASQLGQIQQDAEQEALAYIPEFRNQARQDYQSRLAQAAQALQFAAGRGDLAYDRAYQSSRDARGDMESDRNYDRSVLESDRAFDRGVLESDRGFDRGVLESDRAFQFQQQQFDESIRQFGIDEALRRAGMEQDAKQFAASQGLQWAQLDESRKRRIADETFREKQFRADQDLANKQYELDVQREERLGREQTQPASPIDPVYERALELASKDQAFLQMNSQERQELINFYVGQLRPGPMYGPPVITMTDDDLLQYLK